MAPANRQQWLLLAKNLVHEHEFENIALRVGRVDRFGHRLGYILTIKPRIEIVAASKQHAIAMGNRIHDEILVGDAWSNARKAAPGLNGAGVVHGQAERQV